jgi:Zn-dependent M28 family amino/carboxypeptidase
MNAAALLAAVSLFVSAAPAKPAATPEQQAARALTAPSLSEHIRILASDEFEGRGPGTAGDQRAQKYIAEQFQKLGLKPGVNGGWFQPVKLMGANAHPDKLVLSGKGQALELQSPVDFIANAGDLKTRTQLKDAELVFVGYGIQAPEFGWDDYKGADMKGKVLVMMNNDPDWDPALFAGKSRLWYGRWDYKYEIAAKVGAAGAIIIHSTPSAGYPWTVVRNSWTGEQFELPSAGGPKLQVKAWTTEDATRRLLKLSGQELESLIVAARKREFQPVPLGVTLSIDFKSEVREIETGNVLGLLPGSDPVLSKEVVIITAHHDHLGKKEGGKPGEDVIYNGAVDNASGVAQMLTIAKGLTALPTAPRRSILFAAVAAEEQGLLGSQYLAEHPPVPVGRIAANLNLDGANIWGRTRDVIVIGLGKSDLDARITAIAKRQGRVVVPDQFPDRGFFYRSDQFNFAKLGVPAAYADSGVDYVGRPKGWGTEQRRKFESTHYHQPSDQFDPKWDLSGALQDCELYYWLALEVANADEMPKWTPGDEFELPRKKALEALQAPAK